MTPEELLKKAKEAQQNAYAPYSNFYVGAALLCKDGSLYTGCNVENSAYPAGICAERSALSKAVSEGKHEFTAIAIVGGPEGSTADFCYPCGICRQALSEFVNIDFKYYFQNSDGDIISLTEADLLPHSFNL